MRETCHARRATSMLPFPTFAGAAGDGALAVRFAHQVLQALRARPVDRQRGAVDDLAVGQQHAKRGVVE
ncbi:MAG: hypothetical protein ACJ76T_16240 [Solirubrobacteraceae bacterium]